MEKELLSLLERYCALDVYALIPWPDAQEFMEEPWFGKECVEYLGFSKVRCLSPAYLIPVRRMPK